MATPELPYSEIVVDLGLKFAAERLAPAHVPSTWWCDRTECDGKPHEPWSWKHARSPSQRPPDGDWLTWLYLGGRGTGKTRTGAEWVIDLVKSGKGWRGALVARTPADARDVMIYGESGIMEKSPDDFRPVHEPTKRCLTWPNGAKAWTYSAAAPSQLRGPQHDFAWADELAAWFDAKKGDVLDTSWNNLMLGLRLGKHPRCLVTTTPKRVRLVRELLDRSMTAVTRGTTYENLENLSPAFRAEVLTVYEGTRIGRQELMAEMLTDVEGALWSLATLDGYRVDNAPDLARVVVAIDPAVSSGDDADETGIIVAGRGVDREGYVLADRSCRMSPDGWARRAVAAYHEFNADRIVAEKNNGGDMVALTLRTVDPNVPVQLVHASRGKIPRAEPVAALYEQGRVHHVGSLPRLEDQLTTWTQDSGDSPDRMDALVWALTELMVTNQQPMWLGAW